MIQPLVGLVQAQVAHLPGMFFFLVRNVVFFVYLITLIKYFWSVCYFIRVHEDNVWMPHFAGCLQFEHLIY